MFLAGLGKSLNCNMKLSLAQINFFTVKNILSPLLKQLIIGLNKLANYKFRKTIEFKHFYKHTSLTTFRKHC